MMITKYDNPYQTRHQLEKLLQVSPATIYRWIKEGNFPKPLRLGANMVRWKASDIEAWIKDRENNNFKGDSNAN
jgi:predicted DNA-binding transcriptional regulator AlpA|tara:strand:- start:200 stop:421 length:222 start_codon:yes stop_codon:yes gene_type:complete